MNEPRFEITSVTIAFITTICVGIFLSLVTMLSKKGNRNANKFLSLLLLIFSILQVWEVLIRTKLIFNYPHLLLVLNPLIYALGPLFYFYSKSLTDVHWKFKLKYCIHFIPIIISYIYFFPKYLLSEQEKIQLLVNALEYNKYLMPLSFFLLAILHILIYVMFTVKILIEYAHFIKQNYSYTERINLNWLKVLLTIFIVLLIVFTFRMTLRTRLLWDINAFLAVLTIYITGYYGYNNPADVQKSDQNTYLNRKEMKKKYATSSLTENETSEYLKKIKVVMENEKIFLKNDLKLGELADKLKLPVYYVSQVINERIGKNFYDFINEYRVEEVKKRIADKSNDNLTLLAIGFDSGFNSKTAYYSAFKRNTGLTPSDFKKKIVSEQAS